MLVGLTTGLTPINNQSGGGGGGGGTPAAPDVFALLGDRDGVAIDFVSRTMTINDSQTPANAYSGDPEARLEKFGADPYVYDPVKGLAVEAARDFSVALRTAEFPFAPDACTIYIRYRLSAASTSEIRHLFSYDVGGNDRFLANYPVGQNVRFSTGDGTAANLASSTLAPAADQPLTCVLGCDALGKSFVDDGGIQTDTVISLNTSDRAFFGIGGYPDQVLRVLDGHIEQFLMICEPVAKADRLTLTPYPPASQAASPAAFDVLGGRDGFAIDFIGNQMRINDRATLANNFTGNPETKLTKYGADPYLYDPVKGLALDSARDFGIAMATSLFPYNPAACTIYARFRLNAADSSAQRNIFYVEKGGINRFATYTTSGLGFRFVTGDGATADVDVSSAPLAPDTEYEVIFGCDATGKSWVDHGGLQSDSANTLQAIIPTYVGIGGYPDQVLRVLDGHLAEIAVVCETLPKDVRLGLPVGNVYRAEGDSHTYNTAFGLQPEEFYPQLVADALGDDTNVLNLGDGGDSTAQMVFQLPSMIAGARPDIATIYAGSNDGNIAITADTTPTTTTFSVNPSIANRLEPGGHIFVDGEATIVTARNVAQITVSPALSQAPSAGAFVTVDTQTNLELWIDTMLAEGCKNILVIGCHFHNFASGGDTLLAQDAGLAATRAKQLAAATSRGVPYCDTYAHMSGLVQAGQVSEGDDLAWHTSVGNAHLNPAGEAAVASAVIARMNELGWV